jgi:hypothetical protein
MRNKGFHEFVSVSHIGQNHDEIVLRSSQEIWTKDNGQGFRGHMIVLLKVRDSEDWVIKCDDTAVVRRTCLNAQKLV